MVWYQSLFGQIRSIINQSLIKFDQLLIKMLIKRLKMVEFNQKKSKAVLRLAYSNQKLESPKNKCLFLGLIPAHGSNRWLYSGWCSGHHNSSCSDNWKWKCSRDCPQWQCGQRGSNCEQTGQTVEQKEEHRPNDQTPHRHSYPFFAHRVSPGKDVFLSFTHWANPIKYFTPLDKFTNLSQSLITYFD